MSKRVSYYNFTPMSEADALAMYGPNLGDARLFEYCDKQAGSTESIRAYSYFILHFISGAKVEVIDGRFMVGDDVAEEWSDEAYSTAIHDVNFYMNDRYAEGMLHPWLVKACEASRGWEWHVHEHAPLPRVRALVLAEVGNWVKRSFARVRGLGSQVILRK